MEKIAENIRPEIATLAVPINSLKQWPGNPRRGDLVTLKSSLTTNGQFKPIIVQRSTMQICAGNHTWEAARDLGWDNIAAVVMELPDDDAKRVLAADNRASEGGTNDDRLLADLLSSLGEGNLEGTGYDPDDLDDLLASLGGGAPVLYDTIGIGDAPLAALPAPALFSDGSTPPATYGAAPSAFASEGLSSVPSPAPAAAMDAYAPRFNPQRNETEEEEAKRAARLENHVPHRASGLTETILLLPEDDRAELGRLFARVKQVIGDQPSGPVALTCARVCAAVLDGAAGHKKDCGCTWCAVAREAGATAARTVEAVA